jgi:hypothetical protein
MNKLHVLAAAMALTLAGSAFSAEYILPTAASKAQFAEVRAHLIEQLNSEQYRAITPDDKQTVMGALDRIQARYDKVASAAQLTDQDRVDIFNDQEVINTIVTHAAADSRLICEREMTTGSHLVKVICIPLGIRKARQSEANIAMDRIENNHNNTYPGGE